MKMDTEINGIALRAQNTAIFIWSVNLQQGKQEYPMGKRQTLQQMVKIEQLYEKKKLIWTTVLHHTQK